MVRFFFFCCLASVVVFSLLASLFSRRRVRCIACFDSSWIVGIGVLFLVLRRWILGWARSTLGAVGLCDVDGVFTLGTGVLFTLGTDCCSVVSSFSTTLCP